MDSYKIKQNLLGLVNAYATPFLLIFIAATFLFSYFDKHNTTSIIYLLVFIPIIAYRYFIYIKKPMEIEVIGNQIKMKDIFGKITECSFSDLTDIELTKRKEIFFTIGERKIRSLNTYKNFDVFIEDAKKKNPDIKLWGFEKN